MTERELQTGVIDVLHRHNWRVAHFHNVPVQRGGKTVWMTPVAADGKGFPDLIAVRGTLLAIELKIHPVVFKPEQIEWKEALLTAGVRYCVWTDRDYLDGMIDEIVR